MLAVNWIDVHEIADNALQSSTLHGLHEGEVGAIGLAIELGGTLPILLDDLAARRYASRLGLHVTGTGGVLVGAKDEGLISTVRPDLDRLRNAGLRISNHAYAEILRLAGENTVET